MNEGIEQLKRHEGFRGTPYKCTANKWTIGYGRNIEDNPLKPSEMESIGLGPTIPPLELEITKEQATKLLEMDVKKYIHAVDTSFPDVMQLLNEPRKWVLYNMAFNMGMTSIRKFNGMLSGILQGNFIKASVEMLDSKWAKQVGKRAQELALQMKKGEWQNG